MSDGGVEMNGINTFINLSKNYLENAEIRKYMFRDEVSQKILAAMEVKGITKASLAKLLHTSKSNVSQILNGNRNLTIDTLCEISMALGMIPVFDLTVKERTDNIG